MVASAPSWTHSIDVAASCSEYHGDLTHDTCSMVSASNEFNTASAQVLPNFRHQPVLQQGEKGCFTKEQISPTCCEASPYGCAWHAILLLSVCRG